MYEGFPKIQNVLTGGPCQKGCSMLGSLLIIGVTLFRENATWVLFFKQYLPLINGMVWLKVREPYRVAGMGYLVQIQKEDAKNQT